MTADIERMLRDAAETLLGEQPDIFHVSPGTVVTEWNISHHLANYIHRLNPDYHCDVELLKNDFGDRRPDIVLHRRGQQERNFLVIEVKRRIADIDLDVRKIRDNWFLPPLSYRYGAVIALDSGVAPSIVVIENPS